MTYAKINIGQVLQFGSDDDDVSLAPIGTALPTDLTSPLDPKFQEVGLLNSDGLTIKPSDSVDKRKGHQGNRVYKKIMTDSDTDLSFIALQSNLQTLGLQWQIKSSTKDAGGKFSTHVLSNARKVDAYAIVVRVYANGHTYLWACSRFEIGERNELKFSNTEDTAYAVNGTFVTDIIFITDDPAFMPS